MYPPTLAMGALSFVIVCLCVTQTGEERSDNPEIIRYVRNDWRFTKPNNRDYKDFMTW